MENTIIGIDISSKTLDICLKRGAFTEYFTIANTQRAVKEFFHAYKTSEPTVAMENTGRYNWNLYDVLPSFNFKVFVLNPLHLSKSQGLVRGKDDRTDAYRIALFAQRNMDTLTPWRPTPKAIEKIKVLITERNARIKSKRRLKKQRHDYQRMESLGLSDDLENWNRQQVSQLDGQIKKIEELIQRTIDQDEELKQQYSLMLSIPGVGKVVGWTMIAKTEGFSKIKDPRKMACYSGVAPFEHQSGTSVYRRPRVSPFADKQVKSVLHLAAMSAIRLNNDLRHFYLRKVKEGKNKMSVINALRNKIIHIIFAVVKSRKSYQNRLVMS